MPYTGFRGPALFPGYLTHPFCPGYYAECMGYQGRVIFFKTGIKVCGNVFVSFQIFGSPLHHHVKGAMELTPALAVYFFVMPRNADIRPLQEIFRARVLRMLRKEGLVDDAFIRMIMQWRHTSGFSVHNQVRLARADAKWQESLAQYIIRNKRVCETSTRFLSRRSTTWRMPARSSTVKDDPWQEQEEL